MRTDRRPAGAAPEQRRAARAPAPLALLLGHGDGGERRGTIFASAPGVLATRTAASWLGACFASLRAARLDCTEPKSGDTGSSDLNRLMLLWIRKPLKRKSAPISAFAPPLIVPPDGIGLFRVRPGASTSSRSTAACSVWRWVVSAGVIAALVLAELEPDATKRLDLRCG